MKPVLKENAGSEGLAAGGFLDRAQIGQMQLRKLRRMLDTLRPANPFYAHKLAGLQPGVVFETLEEFSRQVPPTTKHELVRDRLTHPPYGSGLTFPLDRYVRCHQTSGSTAVPIRWLDTADSWNHLVENWVEILEVAGVTRPDRFFFAFSFGPFLGFWSALEAVIRLGCFCFPGGSMTSLARLQAILDNEITVLCCTPTYAQHLGELAREKHLDLSRSRLRLLVVAGESGGSIPATRTRIESLWPGAKVFDHHGMTETGPVTFQCPARPGVLHVIGSAYLPEILKPHSTEAAGQGETGELVLTTLDRVGSPVLRYRTGDLVKPAVSAVCACGRQELALQGGILGRSDDMVVVRGVNIYPSLLEEIVRTAPQVSEYRVEVDCRKAMHEITVEIEPAPEASGLQTLQRELEESLQAALHLRLPVRVLPPGSLPRFEMKARRWSRITE
jgi:phenylacetate-CoA ligase